MALTQIKTTAIADDAVTTDKLANAINTERTANTAKATNATHTGEVTGSGALTIANDAVTGAKIADDAVGAEHIEVLDAALQFGDNVKAQFGASNDLEIYHNGTDTGLVNNTGGLYIQNDGTVFIGDVGGNEFGAKFIDNGAVELYYDNSKKFEIYSGGVEWHGNLKNETDGVNEGIYLGAQNDFGLYHDGSNSFLLNKTGNLYIQGDSSSTTEEILIRPKSGEQSARFIANGAVELYYNNVKKLATDSTYGTVLSNTTDNASYTNALLLTRRGYEASGYGVIFQAKGGSVSSQNGLNIRISSGSGYLDRFTFDNEGLKFNGDTAAANALDDYEEGTWTPTATSGTFAVASGTYTKIGRLVTAFFVIEVHSTTSGNHMQFNGLPFTNAGNAGENMSSIAYNETGNVMRIYVNDGVAGLFWNDSTSFFSYANCSGDRIRGGVSYFAST